MSPVPDHPLRRQDDCPHLERHKTMLERMQFHSAASWILKYFLISTCIATLTLAYRTWKTLSSIYGAMSAVVTSVGVQSETTKAIQHDITEHRKQFERQEKKEDGAKK